MPISGAVTLTDTLDDLQQLFTTLGEPHWIIVRRRHVVRTGTSDVSSLLARKLEGHLHAAAHDVTGLLAEAHVAGGVVLRGDDEVFGQHAAQHQVAEEALDVSARPLRAQTVHVELIVPLLHDPRHLRACKRMREQAS